MFMPNKYYAYLLNAEPNYLVFLETYNNDFKSWVYRKQNLWKIVKPKYIAAENSRDVEEIFIPAELRQQILNDWNGTP